MSAQLEFYQQRALVARADAEAAVLDNVRDRFLNAAVAWEGMATRAARTERMRADLEARKRMEREAEVV